MGKRGIPKGKISRASGSKPVPQQVQTFFSVAGEDNFTHGNPEVWVYMNALYWRLCILEFNKGSAPSVELPFRRTFVP